MFYQESYKNTNSVAPGPDKNPFNYADHFRITRTNTYSLRDPFVFNRYVSSGLQHIRKLHYEYNKIAREPTVGCYVELSVYPEIGSFPIHSAKARRLINRMSYF